MQKHSSRVVVDRIFWFGDDRAKRRIDPSSKMTVRKCVPMRISDEDCVLDESAQIWDPAQNCLMLGLRLVQHH